jgi:hypothetical protein
MKLKKIEKKDGCRLGEYSISGATIKNGSCKLFETTDGIKIAVCHDKGKIKIFKIDEDY